MKEVETRKPIKEINRLHSVGNLGVGGERGEVFMVDGLCPSQSATQYKDAIKVIVNEKQQGNIFW